MLSESKGVDVKKKKENGGSPLFHSLFGFLDAFLSEFYTFFSSFLSYFDAFLGSLFSDF